MSRQPLDTQAERMQDIGERFKQLIQAGQQLVARLPRDEHGPKHWVPEDEQPEYNAWLASAANLFRVVAGGGNYYFDASERLINHEHMSSGIPQLVLRKMLGLLTAAHEDWTKGLLRKIEYLVAAATFDDFLDHASEYHRSNKKMEAGVLAGAVLEDTIRKIAARAGVPASGTLDPTIDELARVGVFNSVRAKRVKGYAAVRNSALHARWDEFEIRDVGELIAGTRSLIEEHLS